MYRRRLPSRVFVTGSLTLGLTAPVWWIVSWQLALGWPGMEPFPSARSYIISWLVTSLALVAPASLIALCLAVFISHHSRFRASAGLQALNWLWVLAPIHIVWCVALLVCLSFGPNFDPFLYTKGFPASWRIPATYLGSSAAMALVWLFAAAFVLYRVIHAYSTTQGPPDPAVSCDRCGYPRAGLASSTCPECGSRLLTIMNRRESEPDESETK